MRELSGRSLHALGDRAVGSLDRRARRRPRSRRKPLARGASIADRASPMVSAAATAFLGSCHQCGSTSPPPSDLTTVAESRSEITSASVPGALDQLVDPLVHLAARGDDQLGLGDRGRVAGPGLVVVRIRVRGEDAVNLDAVACDVAGDVRRLGRGRDDLGAACRRRTSGSPRARGGRATQMRLIRNITPRIIAPPAPALAPSPLRYGTR